MHSMPGIIGKYGAGLARTAASYEVDPALREDLLQEMLLAIYRALPSLRDSASVGPFVFRIAHNRGVTHVIRQTARKRAEAAGMDDEPEDWRETPETHLAEQERSRRLAAAIRRLPIPYRQAITLVLEGFSYAQIADTLGISVANVGIRVNRAKSKLKDSLGHE